MKNYQKGFIVPALIVIGILAIGGAVYLYANKSSGQQSSLQSVANDHPTGVFGSNHSNAFTGSPDVALNIVRLDINDPSVAKLDKNKNAYVLTQGDTEGRTITIKINSSSATTFPLKYAEPFDVSWNTTGVDTCSFGGPTGIQYELNEVNKSGRAAYIGALPTSGTIKVYAKNFEDYMSPFSFEINCSSKTNKYLAASIMIPTVVPSISSFAFTSPAKGSTQYMECGSNIKWDFSYPLSSIDFQLLDAKNNQPIDSDRSHLYGILGRNLPNEYSWSASSLPEGPYYIKGNVNKIPVDFKSDVFNLKHIPQNIKTGQAREDFCRKL